MLFYGIFNEADTMTGFRMLLLYWLVTVGKRIPSRGPQNSDRRYLDEMVSWKRIHGCGFEAGRYVRFL